MRLWYHDIVRIKCSDIVKYNVKNLLEIKNINEYFQLPSNYELFVFKKKEDTITVHLKYTKKQEIQNISSKIPYDILCHIYDYLVQSIHIELDLNIIILGYIHVIPQWKMRHIKYKIHSSKYDVEDIYKHVIEYRNQLLHKKRRYMHRYYTIFNIMLIQEIISLIADFNDFYFIF